MKKKIIIIISTIIVIALITVSVMILKNKAKVNDKKDYLLIKDNLTYEVNSEVKNIDLLKEENNQLGYKLINEENIDTSKLGKYEYTFKYKNKKDIQKEQNVEYEIIDTISPEINALENIELTVGDELKISDIATVTDNSKEELEVKIDGEYDINTPGEYKVKLVSEDSSKNKLEKDFTIIVKEKPVEQPKQNNTVNTVPKNNSNNQSSNPSNNQNNVSSNTPNSSNNQFNSSMEDEYDVDYLMKKADQLVAEGRTYGAEIKQKVWTYVPNEINSHIPGATYPIYEANFYWQYIKYGEMRPGDGTVVDLYEWRVKSDMDEYRDVTGRPQMAHRNAAQSYLGTKPTKEGTPNEKRGNAHLYYTSGIGFYETKKYIKAGR